MLKEELATVINRIMALNAALDECENRRANLAKEVSDLVVSRDTLIKRRHELQVQIGKGAQ